MYRSNIQSKLLEEELRQHDVPYAMYGGQQFFERKEVKDVIAYLRLALNNRDELALRRIINYPARGIGATTLEKLVARAHAGHATLWSVMAGAREDGELRAGIRTAIDDFIGVMARLAEALDDGVVHATRQLIDEIGLYDDLRSASPSMSAAQRRIDNVEGLLQTLERGEQRKPGRDGLGDLLRKLTLASSEDEDRGGDRVVLTTLHGAKGLEFPVVFMVGLEEELLPHLRTLQPQVTDVMDADHATDVSEERRLCYVGITRAQEQLYLTRACLRVSRGRSIPRTPSRFLLEIPDELLEVRDLAEEARQQVPTDEVRDFFKQFS
jgi:DNA helicase-2/ATP-dependent DNA helicase PcrA